MSHLVEKMAYVGQEPWHGLGNKLPAGQSIETWASSAGMDWSIEQTPVRFVTGQADGMVNIGSFADQQVLYRSDNNVGVPTVTLLGCKNSSSSCIRDWCMDPLLKAQINTHQMLRAGAASLLKRLWIGGSQLAMYGIIPM